MTKSSKPSSFRFLVSTSWNNSLSLFVAILQLTRGKNAFTSFNVTLSANNKKYENTIGYMIDIEITLHKYMIHFD